MTQIQNPLELPFITPVETPTIELATPIAAPMAQPIVTPTVELATTYCIPNSTTYCDTYCYTT